MKKQKTLSLFFKEEYCPWMNMNVKSNTSETKSNMIEKYIVPFFRNDMLKEISENRITEWHRWLGAQRKKNGKPFSQSYLKSIHNQLVAILNHAKKLKYINSNPAVSVGNIGNDKETKMYIWDANMFEMFSSSVTDPREKAAFDLMFWCALRPNECLSAGWHDIDFEKGTLMLNCVPPKRKGNWGCGELSLASRFEPRIIDIPPFLMADMQMLKKSMGDRPPFEGLTRQTLLDTLEKNCKNTGLGKMTLLCLRDSGIATMLASRISPTEIAAYSGLSLQALERKYFPFMKNGEEVAKMLEAIHDAVHGGPRQRYKRDQRKWKDQVLSKMTMETFCNWFKLGQNIIQEFKKADLLKISDILRLNSQWLIDEFGVDAKSVDSFETAISRYGFHLGMNRKELERTIHWEQTPAYGKYMETKKAK